MNARRSAYGGQAGTRRRGKPVKRRTGRYRRTYRWAERDTWVSLFWLAVGYGMGRVDAIGWTGQW